MLPRPRKIPAWAANGAALLVSLVAAGSGTWPSGALGQQLPDLVDRSALRVCADPADLPFSNQAGEGFENKIAELLAERLGVPVLYTWFPQVTGFVRNTLRAHKCDLIIGYAQGDELVQNTNPYYRSSYALVYKPGSAIDGVENLSDRRLKGRKLGIVAGTPPATTMAREGLMATSKPYHLVVDRRFTSPAETMIGEVASGAIDGAVLWGPMAGYYAKNNGAPLKVVPLVKETTGPRTVYRITMGIRPNEPEWKHQLNRLIEENQSAINDILLAYGVPLVDERGQPFSQ